MKRMLSEVPIEELQIGDKVISVLGTNGVISDIAEDEYTLAEGPSIFIDWENGAKSLQYQCMLDKVEYAEDQIQAIDVNREEIQDWNELSRILESGEYKHDESIFANKLSQYIEKYKRK